MKTYFTSDTHFNHANILGFCRGASFKTIEEMNQTIIDRWNAVVKPEDHVYHLGDFAMGDKSKHAGFLSSLNGSVTLIAGNHDTKPGKAGFRLVFSSILTLLEGKRIFMRHLPPPDLDGSNRPWLYANVQGPPAYDYFLCGHVHKQWKKQGNIINVGVDQWNFTPRTLDELIA